MGTDDIRGEIEEHKMRLPNGVVGITLNGEPLYSFSESKLMELVQRREIAGVREFADKLKGFNLVLAVSGDPMNGLEEYETEFWPELRIEIDRLLAEWEGRS